MRLSSSPPNETTEEAHPPICQVNNCWTLATATLRIRTTSPRAGCSQLSPKTDWSWSLLLHHEMSEDGCSASFQQPTAPLAGAPRGRTHGLGFSSQRGNESYHVGIRTASPQQDAATNSRLSVKLRMIRPLLGSSQAPEGSFIAASLPCTLAGADPALHSSVLALSLIHISEPTRPY